MVSEELNKARARIRRFLAEHPRLSRLEFARRAEIHRNTIYGDSSKWSPETIDKCLVVISEFASEEAKAQRKARPRLAKAA